MITIPDYVWIALAVAIVGAAFGWAAVAILTVFHVRRASRGMRHHDWIIERDSREFDERFKQTQEDIERGARPAGSKGFKL